MKNAAIRRNFKKKVKVIKPFAYLKIGDVLESVTMRNGMYSGILKTDEGMEKRHIPISYTEEITDK